MRPDLTCLGKIIGGGLPVGAYGGRADLMELVSPAGPVYQAGTLSGNPLAMTAGLWCLEHLSPKLYASLAALGARLAAGLADAARDAGVAAAGQRVRLAAHAVLHRSAGARLRVGDRARTPTRTRAFFRGMLARGVYPPPSQFEAWFLSAAHTAKDVDATIKAAQRGDESGDQRGRRSQLSAQRRSSGESSRTRSTVPAGSSTSLPSVAAIVPPPPIRMPASAPLAPPRIAADDRADARADRRSRPVSPLIPSLSSACMRRLIGAGAGVGVSAACRRREGRAPQI